MGKMKDILLKATMEYEEKLKRGAKSIDMKDLHIEKHGIQPVYFLEGVPVDKDTLMNLFPLLRMNTD